MARNPQAPPPSLSKNRVAQLIQSSYPIIPHSIHLMNGSDDCNYLVKGSLIGDNARKEYIFKVMIENNPDYFDAITKLMYHINQEGFKVPLPVQPLNNNKNAIFLKKSFLIQKEVQDDVTYGGLLLNYLPGSILSEVDRSPKLLYNIGTSVGKLSTVLQVRTYVFILKLSVILELFCMITDIYTYSMCTYTLFASSSQSTHGL